MARKQLSKEEQERAEKDRMKKQLMLLGVLMIAVVGVNRKSIMKMLGMGGTSTSGRRGRRVTRAAPAVASRPGAPAATPARAAAGNRAAVTPAMIPVLDEATKRKLHQIGKPSEIVPEDEIRYETRNPFIALSLDDREVIKGQDDQAKKLLLGSQGLSAADPGDSAGSVSLAGSTMFFRGVIPQNGVRYAILQAAAHPRPRPVKEGDPVSGTDWVLLSIGPRDAFVVLHNPKSKRERDKISVVNRDGIKPEDLFMARNEMLLTAGVDVSQQKRRGEADSIVPVMLAMLEKRNGAPPQATGSESGTAPSEVAPETSPKTPAGKTEAIPDSTEKPEFTEADDGFSFFDE